MTEPQKLKPWNEVVRSPRFKKEISLLLFFFSAVQAIFSVFVFAGSGSSPEVLFTAISGLMIAIVYAVLGILIRHGSISALVFTGILFVADTLLALFGPSWEAARGVIIARGLLIFVLARFLKRERRAVAAPVEN